jgi:hypothetical protein
MRFLKGTAGPEFISSDQEDLMVLNDQSLVSNIFAHNSDSSDY